MLQIFSCPRCGAQISPAQNVCGACGERFEYRCVRCHAAIKPSNRFCTHCGQELHKPIGLLNPPAHAAATNYHTGRVPIQVLRQVPGQTPGQMPVQKQPRPLPIGKVGACLVSIVIILCLVVTFHAVGAATLEKPPLGLDGGIIFKGAATNRYIPATLSSTSTVPTNLPSTGTVDAPKPAPPTNVARFTAAEVTALARKFSPQCRKLAYTGTVR